MTTPILLKKSLDIPKDLFTRIMDFANDTEIYKFTPAVISLLEKALDIHEAE